MLFRSYRAVCSTEFLVAIPKSYVSREYLFCLLGNEVFGGVFTTLVTGTSGSHQRVKPEGLLRMKVAVPGEALISSFSNTIKPLLARVSLALDETDSLASTRDALLPKLISGQLRVKDAERVVGSRV